MTNTNTGTRPTWSNKHDMKKQLWAYQQTDEGNYIIISCSVNSLTVKQEILYLVTFSIKPHT